ncbi:MAG: heme exporter protein CcmB [Saprospiraceae bacterium]|nr:heme exporter protein CcmB [Saprospiraceae bacterium]
MSNFNRIKAYLKRDYLLERRNKSIIGSALVYLLSVVFICLHAFETLDPDSWTALFWIVLLFTVLNAVGRSFERESGSAYLYHFHLAKPTQIILAKLFINALFAIILGLFAFGIFVVFLGSSISNYTYFLLTLIVGSAAIGSTFTLTAAITARVQGNLVLMAILSLPLILPLVLLLVKMTSRVFGAYGTSSGLPLLGGLIGFNVLVIILSVVLFPYLWRD